jgi:hypothetical protein
MDIDQTWTNDQSSGVDLFDLRFGLVALGHGDFAINNPKIGHLIAVVGWVDDPTVANNRSHDQFTPPQR